MSYPASLKSAAMRLSNYSSTIRRVTPLGKDSGYKANDSVRFLLPSNALCDLKSLALHFVGSTRADPASDGKGIVLFPALSTSLIDQITVSFNGVQVSSTPRQWGALAKMLDDFTTGNEKRRARLLQQNEKIAGIDTKTGQFYKAALLENSDAAAGYPTVTPGDRETNRRLCVDEFPGCFLGTCEPSIISTALTGDVMIEIKFAPNSVLVATRLAGYRPAAGDTDGVTRMEIDGEEQTDAAGGALGIANDADPVSPSYYLDDVHLTVKTIDVADGKFYEWLKAQVTDEGPFNLAFQQWVLQPGAVTAPGSATQTTRMTVNSSSIDMILGTFVGSDYESNTVIPGSSIVYTAPNTRAAAAARPSSYARAGTYGNTQTSRYFQRGGIDAAQPFESSFSVNNVQLDFPADLSHIWNRVKNEFALGESANTNLNPRLQTLTQFAQGFFVAPCRLSLNTYGSYNSRLLSGLDSRASSVHVSWSTKGGSERLADNATGQQLIPQLWAGTTMLARISPGRVIDLVF